MDDDQFLEAYLNTLEVSEGAEGGDTVTGMATRPYGVKDLLGVNEEDYKDNPRGLAKAVASKNIDELKRMGIDWDNLPASMKFNALDIQFNMGSLNKKAPKYFKAVKAGNYDTAIKESLDAIGAYDPKRKGERPTKGIALRRAMLYNMVAKEMGYPTITSVEAINQDNPQKSAKVTYNRSEGAAIPVTYETLSLHSTTKPGTVTVSETMGMTAQPVTDDVVDDFSEPLPVTPEPKPKPPSIPTPQPKPETDDSDVVESGTTDLLEDVAQEEFQKSVEAADKDEQEQQMQSLLIDTPSIQTRDVAPDTTDAIPPAMVDVPEDKNIFERAYDYMFGDKDTPEEIQQREQTRQRLLQSLEMNEGGMAIEKQMEMFEDGGLMDEGGTVDPVSGNDVPPGSTQEEVRDDIPAQLSEGEFVFPADVVRYIGLEKLMQMRQEAKMGLKRMEDMGQMGNSEEAVMPDDLPFTLDDLEMEDEPMEFQVGGLVPNPYGTYQQASQFASYGQQPYQAPTIPTGQPIQQQPVQAAGFQTLPVQQVPTAPSTVPTFEQLMPTTTGKYDELREYVNEDTGQSMTIPFVDGKPIYPIPQGFTPKPTEQVEAAVPETTTVPTARVAQVSGDDDDRDDGLGSGGGRIGMGGFSDGTGRKQNATIMGVSFDMGEGFIGGAMGIGATALSLATGKPIPAEAKATFTYDNATYTVSGNEYNELKKSGYTGDLADKIVASLKTESGVRRGTIEYNKETGTFKDKKSGETFQDRDDDNDGIGDILNKAGQSVYNKYNVEDLISGKQKMNQSEKNIASAYNDAQFEAFDFGDDDGGSSSGTSYSLSDIGSDQGNVSAPSDFDSSTSTGFEGYDDDFYNKGGLASNKTPKAKRMKQGGMASKK